jgi:DNA-binding SARP family transcriptional activator
MYFGILGPLVVRAADGDVVIGASKPRALLVRLLLDANRPVPADRLIHDIWDGEPPRSAAQTLQTYVSQLRKALGTDRVVTEAGGYRVVVGDGELDARQFESLIAEGRHALSAGDAARAVPLLRKGVALWRGAPLADATGADWAAAEVARLDELRLVATECVLDAQLELGDTRGVVADAEAAVTHDPLREHLWALLITALYREGRQADALRAYQRIRRQLDEELGIEPSTELQELERRVLRQEPSLAPKQKPTAPPRLLPTGVVTFMLSDVVGSTRLWEKAPAAMTDALARHEVLLREAVERNHGVLLKSRGEGDSTFSVFQRATDAVAAAVEALNSLSGETWPTPSPLEVRIAVHTGEAVERDGDYYGRTVNRAARLRAASMPSQIAVSQATAELVVDDLPDGFRLHALGVQQLRDIDRPETVFVIAPVGEAAPVPMAETEERVPLPPRLAVEPNMGFVGREREAEQLATAFKHASTGTGRVVLIAGEPGIGKTGLAARFARLAHAGGATVLFGRCDEDSGVPYRPWVEAIGHYVANAGNSSLDRLPTRAASDLCRLVPALGDRRRGLTVPGPSDPDADLWSLYAAVAALFATAGADAPVVLVLDDLQWADKPSLLLLRHIVQNAQSSALLVVGTYRDSDLTMDHPLADVLASLRREPASERLMLRGLDDSEVVALVQGASGQSLGDDAVALIHAVCRETDGNPFFVEALLRHLAETGAVYLDDDGQWVPHADLDEAGLPESVREVIGSRVARLGEMCKRTLNVAAVIGQEFDLATLAAALEMREDEVLDSLETAEGAGLLSTFRPGSFTFSHALIATTLYTGLTPTRRAHLHRRVAEAIETADRDGTRVAELARHWTAATAPADRTKAIDCARRAGDQALRALAPDEALRWYNQALELLAEGAQDQHARADLLVRLGRAQRNAGDLTHRDTLLDAARLAREIGDGKLLSRAALANSQGFVGNIDRQIGARIEMLEAALDAIEDADSVTRARLLGTLAAELKVVADFDRCRQLTDKAIAMARRLDNPPLLATVLNLAAFAVWHPRTLQERLAITAEAVAISERLGDRALLHWSANWRVHALVESCDVDEAAHWLDVMARIAAETQQPSLQWSNRAYRAALALLHGDVEEAFRVSADAIRVAGPVSEIDTRIIDAGFVASAAWQRGTLADHVGRMREEQAWYDEQAHALGPRYTADVMNKIQIVMAVSTRPLDVVGMLHQTTSEPDVTPESRSMRALVAQVIGDELGLDVEMLQLDFDRNIGWLGNQVLWTEVCDRFGTTKDAEELLANLAPYHDQVASCGSLWPGSVAGALGILAAKLGRVDEAETYFAEAEDVNSRIRAPFFLARNRVNWARLLLRRGRSGDGERAAELLRSSIEVAREYDCAGVIRDAEALLA